MECVLVFVGFCELGSSFRDGTFASLRWQEGNVPAQHAQAEYLVHLLDAPIRSIEKWLNEIGHFLRRATMCVAVCKIVRCRVKITVSDSVRDQIFLATSLDDARRLSAAQCPVALQVAALVFLA